MSETSAPDIEYQHLSASGTRELGTALTMRYCASTGFGSHDVDYYLWSLRPEAAETVMRIKGVLTNVWISDTGVVYMCVPSEDGVLRYSDLSVASPSSIEEVFRLPFDAVRVWGLDDTHVYAWGTERGAQPPPAALACFDGSAWQPMAPPPFPLLALHGCSPTCLYGVGHQGIARWDGGQWTEVPSPTAESLTGVFVASESEVYISGYGGSVMEGSASGFGVVASLPTGVPLFAVAKFEGELYVGGGPVGLLKRVGTSSELEVIKPNIKATGLEARAGGLAITAPEVIVFTADGVKFTGLGRNFTVTGDPRDP